MRQVGEGRLPRPGLGVNRAGGARTLPGLTVSMYLDIEAIHSWGDHFMAARSTADQSAFRYRPAAQVRQIKKRVPQATKRSVRSSLFEVESA